MNMTTTPPNFIYIALLFVAMLLSGFRVSRSGQSYPFLTFNLHKFIGLGLGIWLVKIVYDRHQTLALEASQISVLGGTILLFIITVVAGGLLSAQSEGGLRSFPDGVWIGISWIHQYLPYLILLATAFSLYRLFF